MENDAGTPKQRRAYQKTNLTRPFSLQAGWADSGTTVRRTKRRKSKQIYFQDLLSPFAQNKTSEISNNARSGIKGLLCAEQDVGNLKKGTSRNSGSPLRRTRRRKFQKMHFQEFWDSCAQSKTSEISKNTLSGILGLLCAEQDVENLKNMYFQELWDSCAQDKTSEIATNPTSGNYGTPVRRTKRQKSQKDALSRILGLLCAEQDVRNLKKCTFRNSGTPVRGTKRQEFQKNARS